MSDISILVNMIKICVFSVLRDLENYHGSSHLYPREFQLGLGGE